MKAKLFAAAAVSAALVSAPAAHAGGTCHTDATAARGDAVTMEGLCFQPATLFHTLIMLILLVGGLLLIARALLPRR